MSNEFKIIMLGTSGAGKTTYMMGMYATMQIGFQGFTITAKDWDRDLELINKWEAFVYGEGQDRWPVGNDQPENYAFNFNYGGKPMIEFEWLDYRGGAIAGLSPENDVQILRDYFKQSSCVFLCISGEYLTNPDNLSFAASQAKVSRMSQFIVELNQAVKPSNSKPFPVVIIITKYDKCKHRKKEDIIEDIKKLFNQLFTPNSGWLVSICPVMVFDEEKKIPKPTNVHLPLFFAIYTKLNEFYKQQGSNIESDKSPSKSGKWLPNFGSGKKPESKPKEASEEIQDIQEKLSLLAKVLKGVKVYLSGEEIKYYD